MSDNKKLKDRNQINEEYKWDLSSLFESDEQWEESFEKVKELSSKIKEYKGRISESGNTLLEVMNLKYKINRITENVVTYAKMKLDEDTRIDKYQGYFSRAEALDVKVEESNSFIIPEILEIEEDTLNDYIKNTEGLSLYRHKFDEILRQKNHTLSYAQEELLAQAGDIAGTPQNIFSMFNNADIKFPTVKDENGEDVEISHGMFIPLMESKDRSVRENAFKGLYSTYLGYKNTFASMLSGEVKKNIFYAKARKYNSALESALDDNNVPTSVYDNLIKAVHNNLDSMHKYMKIRKKALKLDELHMYDLYTSIVKDADMNIPYKECQETILEGLSPMGEEYINLVKQGFDSRWIDVYENRGKRSGAYSWGTYDSNPFILLNYHDTLNNMFTVAHEMGHSLHSYYSKHEQTYIYGGYSIFVAEVASTTNEATLMNYLLNTVKDKNQRLYLLNYYLEQFRSTIYRQTMFAEFEKIIHSEVENGKALTADNLCRIYKELNEKYYGPDVVVDEEIAIEWARIPHFYYNFYVFQYATGFSAAIAFSQKILQNKENLERYIGFLKSGSSDYPINVLKKAGVDMTTPDPVNNALKLFGELVDEMEKLI
ncbi:oligoendopeptidase F [Abyssisolibacter fermentans]|uniref:oligoendopeptidase F n=1 Tax=Abyssisolibacter fermentans TaxID=1766203 RepID=UPI00082EE645|nr:oligoendopeptidase F [Abyssisolibacter fermentans]